jgi:hypothetical protein
MAYQTGVYDYTTRVNDLGKRKGLEDVAGDYGRFMSQERFRRQNADNTSAFQKRFPQIGSQFNRRGLWNSGLRQQGQRDFTQSFQDQQSRAQFDQGAEEQKFQLERTASDAAYQDALRQLFEQFSVQRAAGYDPFAAVRGVVG